MTVHVPVLFHEVMALLQPRPGGLYLDGTVGAGGHTAGLLPSVYASIYCAARVDVLLYTDEQHKKPHCTPVKSNTSWRSLV